MSTNEESFSADLPTRVLVVAADPTLRRVLVDYLRSQGCVAEGVRMPRTAQARITEDVWDRVLLDWSVGLPVRRLLATCAQRSPMTEVTVMVPSQSPMRWNVETISHPFRLSALKAQLGLARAISTAPCPC